MQALATLNPLNPRVTDVVALLAVGVTLLLIILLIIVCGMTGVLKEVFDPEQREEDSQSGSDSC